VTKQRLDSQQIVRDRAKMQRSEQFPNQIAVRYRDFQRPDPTKPLDVGVLLHHMFRRAYTRGPRPSRKRLQDNAASALTECSVGIILHKDIERITARAPNRALWRDTMIEASIFREWNVDRPALERIAHLLCEQTVRLEAIGISCGAIPMTQVDLADAAGLSTVHTSRTIQNLRQFGVLLRNSRAIAVTHWDRLVEIAKCDGR